MGEICLILYDQSFHDDDDDPAILVGVLGVLCIGMVYLLHEIEHSELGLGYQVS